MLRSLYARLLVLSVLLLTAVSLVHAQDARVESVEVSLHEDGWRLDANVDFELHGQLREAAERGLPLYFTADVSISQPRWWWFDKDVIQEERLWSISYNALVRQWKVGTGGLALPVASLDEALALVRRIRGWRIAPPDALEPGTRYHGRLRLRLDVSQLSRPFQVNALNSSAWALATPWRSFVLDTPSVLPDRPS